MLATVNQVAAESQFLSGVLDSGEVFHPLALSASDAYTIRKEISIYERVGILCRIPNWKNRAAGLRLNIQIGEARPSAGDGRDSRFQCRKSPEFILYTRVQTT